MTKPSTRAVAALICGGPPPANTCVAVRRSQSNPEHAITVFASLPLPLGHTQSISWNNYTAFKETFRPLPKEASRLVTQFLKENKFVRTVNMAPEILLPEYDIVSLVVE